MSWSVPDKGEASHNNQSILMQTYLDALVAGHKGEGVISGLTVTAQGTPDMTVAVASGTARINETIVTYAGGNGTITAADGTNPRIDIVQLNSAGALSVVAGTAAASPKAPPLSGNAITLAAVYVPASDTAIASNQIVDLRVIVYDDDVVINFIIDGGGAPITTGIKGYIEAGFNFTITGWTITAEQSGSIVVDVWKDTYANFPPTVADTIAGTEKPTLASAQKNQDLSLSSWTTAVTKGDWFGFSVDSATTVQRVTVSIRGTKLK